ncbi:beta-lactamase family protein [Streptomyces sp. SBST2-5]|uniref:Beta-lactamase family protein n=1 Tax=Streptomyces composti TaxID=2720025 RepID=A0ABX1AE13_9ACTN|nr:serine hydrolase domain-containing protein [Streptomyces composti]NJP53252.1 beta-lactamase family protein [Streptomyces composti]
MTHQPLPSATPAAMGVDAPGVQNFLDALEASPEIEPHSLMILRHGRLVAAGWWAPYAPDRPHLLYSLSKNFTVTAAALAEAEGLLDFDAPAVSYFPEFRADITDPRSRSIRVRHLASMASGHHQEMLDRAVAADPGEPVRGFLLQPPESEPGTVFAYNQPNTYTLGAIVQRVTGQSLSGYLRPRLLDPLGIGEVHWLRDGTGREIGFSGLHATTDAVARLGQLYLADGRWQGRRLLPEGWVARASRRHIATADPEGDRPDWGQGYGLHFWMARHGYRGDGAHGQFCLVLPEHDAVIAATSASGMQDYLDLVWRHLLPAFRPRPLVGRDAEDAALGERLARLALPPATGSPEPPRPDPAPVTFTPAGGVCTDQPGLTAVDVEARPGGESAVSLTENGHRLGLRLRGEGWTVAEQPLPTAVSGGWTDDGRLVLDVLFLETPHRLTLVCSRADRTFTARWHTQPLHTPPLRALRAPRGTD